MLKLDQWLFADEKQVIDEIFALSALAEIYSGISSEVNQLPEALNLHNQSGHPTKAAVFLVFDRLLSALSQDPGLVVHYFPQVSPPYQLLNQLQSRYQSAN